MRTIVSPILLFGVDAPAVMPIAPAVGSQSVGPALALRADRLVADRAACPDLDAVGVLDVIRRHSLRLHSAARWQVLLELYPPTTTITSSGSSSSASTASCRSCVAQQIVSNERNCVASAVGAVAPLDAAPDLLRDRQRLAGEHRRLIRDADPLEVASRIESGRARLARTARSAQPRRRPAR